MTARDERLRRFAASSYGSGHKDIAECQTCGNLEWRCTYTDRPEGYSVSPMGGGCSTCMEAFRRAPEVVEWVLAVMGKAQEASGVDAGAAGAQPSYAAK